MRGIRILSLQYSNYFAVFISLLCGMLLIYILFICILRGISQKMQIPGSSSHIWMINRHSVEKIECFYFSWGIKLTVADSCLSDLREGIVAFKISYGARILEWTHEIVTYDVLYYLLEYLYILYQYTYKSWFNGMV